MTPQEVLKLVADFYSTTPERIKCKCREKEYLRPRHVAVYVLYYYSNLYQTSVAKLIGRQDHTVVINSIKVVTESNGFPNIKKEAEYLLKKSLKQNAKNITSAIIDSKKSTMPNRNDKFLRLKEFLDRTRGEGRIQYNRAERKFTKKHGGPCYLNFELFEVAQRHFQLTSRQEPKNRG